jgi:phage FluMu protein Com
MAQTLKCTQCGAVMKTAAPVAPGKKVKCPKCNQIFTVAAEETPAAPPASDNPFGGMGDAAAAPAPKSQSSGAKSGGDKAEPPKKGKGMLIGLIVGGVLLLCCCCPGIGGGGWIVYDKYLSGPSIQGHWMAGGGLEQIRIMGGGKAWILDIGDPAKLNPTVSNAKYTIEGKTLDITMDDAKSKIPWADVNRAQFTFELKGDELTLTNTKDSKKTTFKKVDPDKVKIGK